MKNVPYPHICHHVTSRYNDVTIVRAEKNIL